MPVVAPAHSVRDLPPNIFALVMATGIVALALNGAGWTLGGHVLFWIGLAALAILGVLVGVRCTRHWSFVWSDLRSHARAPGFFTTVPAVGVLGSGFVQLQQEPLAGLAFWIVALGLWAGLGYSILPLLMQVEDKPDVGKGLSGVWLLLVVATQSVCVLGCLVAPRLFDPEAGLFLALTFWLVGGMLYLWLIALIFYRLLFHPLAPAELTPPYWINMGAMAISTLAGVSLLAAANGSHLLGELRPFVKGLTLMFWATATWWLPVLLMLGVWRHGVRRFPLTYDHGYWGAVFPLGMYGVCTLRLGRELGLPFLVPLGEVFAWITLAAWAATAVGLGRHLTRTNPPPRQGGGAGTFVPPGS